MLSHHGHGSRPGIYAHAAAATLPVAPELRTELARLRACGLAQVRNSDSPLTVPEAARIIELFRSVYGDTYPLSELSSPERLVEKTRAGHWHSFIIFDSPESMLPIAHAGLAALAPGEFELGKLVVSPADQGKGLSRLATAQRLEFLGGLAAQGLVSVVTSEALTSHTRSQRNLDRVGFLPNGFLFDVYNDYFSRGSRETVLSTAMVVGPAVRGHRKLYIPERLAPLIRTVAAIHGAERSVSQDGLPQQGLEHAGELSVDLSDRDTFGGAYVSVKGWVSQDELRGACIANPDLEGALFVSVTVDVSHPAACRQLEFLSESGFVFGCHLLGHSVDSVVMQRAQPSLATSVRGVQLHSPVSRELLAMIRLVEGF